MKEVQTDIITIILSKLPLKSLIKFSNVCKDWRDIVKDPFFANLRSSTSRLKPLELIMAHRSFRNKNIISVTAIHYNDNLPLVNETPVSHIVSPLPWYYVGACNGLLCFSYFEISALNNVERYVDIMMVCNPVTREHVFLPDQPTFINPSYMFYGRHVAFGFDTMSRCYKVVRILEPPVHLVESESARMKTEVYTLGQSSSGREVQVEYYKLCGDSVYANGSVYWLSRNSDFRIVKFDMANENLKLVPSPSLSNICCMRELNDSLLVLDLSHNDSVTVWKLKDDTSYSWECDHVIDFGGHGLLGMQDLMLLRGLLKAHERDVLVNALFSNAIRTYEERTCNFKDVELKSPARLNWEIYGGFEGSLVALKDVEVVSDRMEYSVCITGDDEMEAHCQQSRRSIRTNSSFPFNCIRSIRTNLSIRIRTIFGSCL